MPVELIWIAAVVTAGSYILGSAIYAEAKQYRETFAKTGRNHRARVQ
jgi:hypothetical protein